MRYPRKRKAISAVHTGIKIVGASFVWLTPTWCTTAIQIRTAFAEYARSM